MPMIEVIPGHKITGHTAISLANRLQVSLEDARALKQGGRLTVEDTENSRGLLSVGVIALAPAATAVPVIDTEPTPEPIGGDEDGG